MTTDAATPFRVMHTMLRVSDLDRSIDFYTRVLGMKLLRRFENPARRALFAFVGYQDEDAGPAIELICEADRVEALTPGTTYGHVALEVENIQAACARIAAGGGNITTPPRAMRTGPGWLAFLKDPDGYEIELIDKKAV